MPFTSQGGDLKNIFITETDILDRFVGNQLWTWGFNSVGPLGDNTNTNKSSPVQTVSGGTNWKSTSGGSNFAAGIKTDGTLWLWGAGLYGNLGNNIGGSYSRRSSPVQTISGGTNWSQVTTNGFVTGAVKTDGTLWVFGRNTNGGGLGTNNNVNQSSPVQTIAGGTNWKQVVVLATDTFVAIKTDGTLWSWGSNGSGQLGDNTITNKSSPVQTISGGTNWCKTFGGATAVQATKTDGTLWLWGNNSSGELGTNDRVNRSSPVQTIAGGTNWKQTSSCSKRTSTAAAIKTDGTLWLWGCNGSGQLGDNTRTNKSSPVQTISGGTNWKDISTGGGTNSGGIKTDGTLWLWGSNLNGQLGNNAATDQSSPVQTIAGGTNWKQVDIGGYRAVAAVTFTS